MSYIYDLTDTWNAAGTVFTSIKMNVTNSASATGSKLIDLQIGGTSLFNVDKSGAVGVGTTTPTGRLDLGAYSGGSLGTTMLKMQDGWHDIITSAAVVGSRYYYGASIYGRAFSNATGFNIDTGTAAVPIAFTTNSAERMRITAAGDVGIGTTSPGNKLSVVGGQINTVADDVYAIALNATTGNTRILPYSTTYTGSALIAYSAGYAGYGPISIDALRIQLWTAGTERMRIDASGNLGLGVTPSAWEASYRAFQFGAGSAFLTGRIGTFQNRQLLLGIGASHNGTNWIYTPTGIAIAHYEQIDGRHQWFNAPSGTAGNTVSWTQAMTLDATGNLSIGTTFNYGRLTAAESVASGDANISIYNSAGAAAGGVQGTKISFLNDTGWTESSPSAYIMTRSNDGGSSGNTSMRFGVYNGSGLIEAARITSAGNVLIGTTSTVGSANAVATNGFNSKTVTVGANATVTTSVPDGCICIISQAGFSSDGAIFAIKSTGGSQATAVIAQNSTGYGFGTTTDPNTGTRTDLWISATNTLSIKDKTSTSRNFMLTFISAGL